MVTHDPIVDTGFFYRTSLTPDDFWPYQSPLISLLRHPGGGFCPWLRNVSTTDISTWKWRYERSTEL